MKTSTRDDDEDGDDKLKEIGDIIWHDATFTVFNPEPSTNYGVNKINDYKIEIWDNR